MLPTNLSEINFILSWEKNWEHRESNPGWRDGKLEHYLSGLPTLLLMTVVCNLLQKLRAAWINVSLQDSSYIPVLASKGFEFHHSKHSQEVTMIKWIPTDEPSQVRIAYFLPATYGQRLRN